MAGDLSEFLKRHVESSVRYRSTIDSIIKQYEEKENLREEELESVLDLMKLQVLKDKNGEFETFPRFGKSRLTRSTRQSHAGVETGNTLDSNQNVTSSFHNEYFPEAEFEALKDISHHVASFIDDGDPEPSDADTLSSYSTCSDESVYSDCLDESPILEQTSICEQASSQDELYLDTDMNEAEREEDQVDHEGQLVRPDLVCDGHGSGMNSRKPKVKGVQFDETFTVEESNFSPRTERNPPLGRPLRKIQTEFIPFTEITERQSGINQPIMFRCDDDDGGFKGNHDRQMYNGTDRSMSKHISKVSSSRNCRSYEKDEIWQQSMEGRTNDEDLVTKPTLQTAKNSLRKHEFISKKRHVFLRPKVEKKFTDKNPEFPFSRNLSLSPRLTSLESVQKEQANMTPTDHKYCDLTDSSRNSPRNSASKSSKSLNKSNSKHTDSGFSTFHEENSNLENNSGKEVSILSMKNLQVFNESFMENTSLLNVTDGLKSPDKQAAAETNQKISFWLNEINAEKQAKTSDRKNSSTERIHRKNSVGSLRLSKEEMQLIEPRNEVEFGEVELHKVPFSPGKVKQHKISSSSTCLLRSPEEELNRSIEKQRSRQTMLSRIPEVIHDRPVIKKCVRKLNIAETFQQMKTFNAGDLLMMDSHQHNLKHCHGPDRVKDTKAVAGKRCIGDVDEDCERDHHLNHAKPRDATDFRLPSKSRRVQSSKKHSSAEQHQGTYFPETFGQEVKEDVLCSPINCIVRQNDEKRLPFSAKDTLNVKENMPIYGSLSQTGKTLEISSYAEQFNQLKSPSARKIIQKYSDSRQRVDQSLSNTCKRGILLNEGQNELDISTVNCDKTYDYKEKQKKGKGQYHESLHQYPEYRNSFDESEDELDIREPYDGYNTFHIDKTQHYRDSYSNIDKVQMKASNKYIAGEQRFENKDKQYCIERSKNYTERPRHFEKNRTCGRDKWYHGPTGYQEDESESVHDTEEYVVDGDGHLTFQQGSCSEGLPSGLLVYEDRKVPNKQIGLSYKEQRYISDESIKNAERDYVEKDSSMYGAQDMVQDFRSPHRLNVACSKHRKSPKSYIPPSNQWFVNTGSNSMQMLNHVSTVGQSGRKNQSYLVSVDNGVNDDDERRVQEEESENDGEYFLPQRRSNRRNEVIKFVENECQELGYNRDKLKDCLQQSEQAVERFLELRHMLDDARKERHGSDSIRQEYHGLGNVRKGPVPVIQGKELNRPSLENYDRGKERQNKLNEIHGVENEQIRNQRSKGVLMTPESHEHIKKDGRESFDTSSVNKEHRFDAFSPSVSMAKLQLNTPTGNRKRTSQDSVRSYTSLSGESGTPNSVHKGSESTCKTDQNKEFQMFSHRNDLSPASSRNRLSQKISKRYQSQVLANLNLLPGREIEEYDLGSYREVRGQGQRLKSYREKDSDFCLDKEDFDCEGFISLDKLSKSTKKFRIKSGQFFKTEADKDLSKSYMDVIEDLDEIDQASSDDQHETLNDTVKPYKQYYQKVVKKTDQCESEKENTMKYFNSSKLNNVDTGARDSILSRKTKTVLARKYPTTQSEVAKAKNIGLSSGTSNSVVKNLQKVTRTDHQVPLKDLRGLSGQSGLKANFKNFFQSTPVKTGSLLQLNETMSTIFGSDGTEKQEEDEIILI